MTLGDNAEPMSPEELAERRAYIERLGAPPSYRQDIQLARLLATIAARDAEIERLGARVESEIMQSATMRQLKEAREEIARWRKEYAETVRELSNDAIRAGRALADCRSATVEECAKVLDERAVVHQKTAAHDKQAGYFTGAHHWQSIARETEKCARDVRALAATPASTVATSTAGEAKGVHFVPGPLCATTATTAVFAASTSAAPKCKRCGKPTSYGGAVYCGAACSAMAEADVPPLGAVCEHGSLARQCPICEAVGERDTAIRERDEARDERDYYKLDATDTLPRACNRIAKLEAAGHAFLTQLDRDSQAGYAPAEVFRHILEMKP